MLRAVRNFRDQAPEIDPWSLKFKDGWLERRFQDEYFDTNLQYQVSEAVYQRLGDRYRFSDVHIVNLKGKGPTAARFLLGKNGSA